MKFKCNLCHSRRAQIIYPASLDRRPAGQRDFACTNAGHGEYYQLVRCRQCGLYYSWPRPDVAGLKQLYSRQTDAVYEAELVGRIKTFTRNLDNLSHFKREGELLDVGASIGVFLNEARKRGFAVSGIEPSLWCVKQANQRFGLKIHSGTDREIKYFGRRFDVVTLWDVLEHVDDPLATLKRCGQALKPDGILAFSTVDIGSLYARLMGRRWPWLMRMHIYYFDRSTIKKYLQAAGLKPIWLKKYRHTVSLNYLLYKLKNISPAFFWWVKLVKRTLLFNRNIYLTFGLGDFMEVYAQKI